MHRRCDVQFMLKSPHPPRQPPTPPLESTATNTIHMPQPILGMSQGLLDGTKRDQEKLVPVITPSSTPFSPENVENAVKTEKATSEQPYCNMARTATSSNIAFISHSPSTFPLQDPSIDNAQLARRKRRRTSPGELSILESEFKKCYKPNKLAREQIAGKVGMTEKAVQIWFQNKRQSQRKQQQIVKLDTSDLETQAIKGSTDGLEARKGRKKDDNDIGQRPGLVRTSYRAVTSSSYELDDRLNASSNKDATFAIYNDPTEPSAVKRNSAGPLLKLSMSDDGKAQVVISNSPLKSISGNRQNTPVSAKNSLKLHRSFSGTTTSTTNNNNNVDQSKAALSSHSSISFTGESSPLKIKDKEAECISNLLSLRSGIWN